jgi:SAM-dependent MidA family methyltransferase
MSLETIMAQLPPLRPGNVWAILIYPGGRSEWREVEPQKIVSRTAALHTLTAVQPDHPELLAAVADAVREGVMLFVDYGMSRAEYYAADRSRGTLMCHYRHRAHDDPFVWPGLQDITAHVDFTAVAEAGVAAGLELAGYSTQAHFLLAGGLDALRAEPVADERAAWARAQQVRKLTLPGEMGERFKVMGFTKGGAPAPLGFALRDLRDRL